jgi:hypothetical protein
MPTGPHLEIRFPTEFISERVSRKRVEEISVIIWNKVEILRNSDFLGTVMFAKQNVPCT